MKSRARFLGHPVHQMLIVFPLGLLATAVVFDVVGLLSDGAAWPLVAYWTMAAGILGALVAAPFGLVDWLAVPQGTRARRIGAIHGLGNAAVTILFVASWVLRSEGSSPDTFALVLSFAGAAISLVTAWLGGELVSRLGVGVHEDAGVNATSSLNLK
ncbi:DUF2231 domain-containing protein [Acidovorax sp. LjRoot129]|uniref:DUF2231 domain-containing protein n=1 Tax=Acidovorax sp. LjRoot129 TaxID=3342260 RepID=UPI003ECE4BBE